MATEDRHGVAQKLDRLENEVDDAERQLGVELTRNIASFEEAAASGLAEGDAHRHRVQAQAATTAGRLRQTARRIADELKRTADAALRK